MTQLNIAGIPKGYQLMKRQDDRQLFLAPSVALKSYEPQVVLVPVQTGYYVQGQYFSTENVPADGMARKLEVVG